MMIRTCKYLIIQGRLIRKDRIPIKHFMSRKQGNTFSTTNSQFVLHQIIPRIMEKIIYIEVHMNLRLLDGPFMNFKHQHMEEGTKTRY